MQMKKARTVLSFADPARGLEPRTLLLGIQAFGASRAFPYDAVIQEKLVLDRVGAEPVLLVVGPDGQSVRVFRDRIPGVKGTRPSTALSMTSSLIRVMPRGSNRPRQLRC